MVYLQGTSTIPDLNKVITAMNGISQKQINVTIKAVGIAPSNYAQQCRLMLTANQRIDLLMVSELPFGEWNTQVSNNQLMPLNDLITKYAPTITTLLGKFLNAGTVNKKILGIPTLRDEAKGGGFIIRDDLVQKYHIDLSNVKSLSDLGSVFSVLKANNSGMNIFYPSQETSAGMDASMMIPEGDNLGTDMYFTGVLMDATDKSLKVVDYYETPQFKELAELVRQWYLKGYVMPSALTNQQAPPDLVKAGTLASMMYQPKPGIETQAQAQCGTKMDVISLATPVSSTATPSAFMWSIPSYSKYSVQAMKYLNLMYTNADLNNLWSYGIKGTHYVINSDGQADYPSGVTAATTGFPGLGGFVFGNQLLTLTWAGQSKTLWSDMKKFNDTAIQSVALGFQFDTTPVKTEFAACTNVWNQYDKAINVGAVDPDTTIPVFISQLKAAGVDKIVAEKQNQLNAWAAANGVK
jgi:putative aldouronate transport system substrate-binding protein